MYVCISVYTYIYIYIYIYRHVCRYVCILRCVHVFQISRYWQKFIFYFVIMDAACGRLKLMCIHWCLLMEEYFNLLTAWITEAMEQKGYGWGRNINILSHRLGQLLAFFREHQTCQHERKQILWYFVTTSEVYPLFYYYYYDITSCVILYGHNILVQCDRVANHKFCATRRYFSGGDQRDQWSLVSKT